jgi:putative transposase
MLREQHFNKPLVLHSDNGAPMKALTMKALTMKAKVEDLGVLSSYSRPRVSNANPYSEALFRTLKYRPEWSSSGFACFTETRDRVENFVVWYNEKHKHSKINLVTPAQRYAGQDGGILLNRKEVMTAAKKAKPYRWSGTSEIGNPLGVLHRIQMIYRVEVSITLKDTVTSRSGYHDIRIE